MIPRKEARYVFALGRVHHRLGGPARTIAGYLDGLRSRGNDVLLLGQGDEESIERSFPAMLGSIRAVEGGLLRQVRALSQVYYSLSSSDVLVLVGVWHLPFFVMATLLAVSRRGMRPRALLIPTMSLTHYDWNKHRRVKSAIKPVVACLLRALDGVVFASSGEERESSPRKWRRSTVVMHPLSHQLTASSIRRREIDAALVGRIDPQKDIELFLESIALSPASRKVSIVGDGSPEYVEQLKVRAKNLGVNDRVTWHGWLDHSATQDVLGNTKVVAVTSRVENFCHVAAEALASAASVVLVDRVLSANDFKAIVDVEVVQAAPLAIASALERRAREWETTADKRDRDARRVADACSPGYAASMLARFACRED